MDKKDRNKWTNKFREMGKKKGTRQDFINLYKEMKIKKNNQENNESNIFKRIISKFKSSLSKTKLSQMYQHRYRNLTEEQLELKRKRDKKYREELKYK